MELKLAHTTRQTMFQFGHDSTWYQFILTQMTLGKYIIHSQCLASYVPVSHRDQKIIVLLINLSQNKPAKRIEELCKFCACDLGENFIIHCCRVTRNVASPKYNLS